MIDFLVDDLPTSLNCGGETVDIKTDFRVWIAFGHDLELASIREERFIPAYIFSGAYTQEQYLNIIINGNDWIQSAIEFCCAKPPTPKASSGGGERTYDFVLDADYIYASFLQAYGIDLVEIEHMHWWKFKALFAGLPSDTKMVEIMQMRGWKKDNSTPDTLHQNLKVLWALPRPQDPAKIEEYEAEYQRQLEYLGLDN